MIVANFVGSDFVDDWGRKLLCDVLWPLEKGWWPSHAAIFFVILENFLDELVLKAELLGKVAVFVVVGSEGLFFCLFLPVRLGIMGSMKSLELDELSLVCSGVNLFDVGMGDVRASLYDWL